MHCSGIRDSIISSLIIQLGSPERARKLSQRITKTISLSDALYAHELLVSMQCMVSKQTVDFEKFRTAVQTN